MLFFDAVLIGITALTAACFCLLFFKEFALLCFDQNYASTQGWPVLRLDMVMMAVVVIVTVVGLQAVGLILVVALLIIPPVAARFWTHQLRAMLLLSALFGGLSGLFGSAISALMAHLPAGAVIVLTASLIFLISLTFGTARGLIRNMLQQHRLRRKIGRENLLRALYEIVEEKAAAKAEEMAVVGISFRFGLGDLLTRRSWTSRDLRQALASLRGANLLSTRDDGSYAFTVQGLKEAARVARKHRLWEAYLISHADIAPSQVDWAADEIEHVLDRQIIEELEKRLPELAGVSVPSSPHEIKLAKGAS
jgi:manganese/zinc/iron transport system permease protein